MAIIYSQACKTARMQAVVDSIGLNGKFVILDSSGNALATLPLGAVAGTVQGSVMTLAGLPITDLEIDLDGVAVSASIRTSADVDVITGLSVGLLAALAPGGVATTDVQLDKLTFVFGEQVSIDLATFTHA